MTDAIRRGIRSFLWAFLGTIISSGILSGIGEAGVVDWAVIKKVGVSALAAGITGLISWVINALEDDDVIPQVVPK